MNRLSVFDHFVGLARKGLKTSKQKNQKNGEHFCRGNCRKKFCFMNFSMFDKNVLSCLNVGFLRFGHTSFHGSILRYAKGFRRF